MKVVHVITTLVYGGAETLLSNFTKIHADSQEITIIYLKGKPLLIDQLDPRITVKKVDLDRFVIQNLRKTLRSIDPEIIHTHLGHADIIGLIASFGLRAKKFCTMHNIWFKWDWRDHVFFFIYKILFKYIAPSCKVISISSAVRDHVNHVLKVQKVNSILIYNAIPFLKEELIKTACRKELGLSNKDYLILFVGRLRVQKSLDTLIKSLPLLNEIKNLKLLVVGSGELENQLKTLAETLNVGDKIEFFGNTDIPEKYMAAVDLFVLPSVFEGLGLVILEAFRAGLPVIATNIEGPKELISSGENGLLFEPKNHLALSQKILTLYDSASLSKKLGQAGKRTFSDNFSIDKYASSLESLYNE